MGKESERDGASVSADEEMPLSEPGLDFDDDESDWFILRTWQKNLEIETIVWPVVPLMALSNPVAHSQPLNAADKCRCSLQGQLP